MKRHLAPYVAAPCCALAILFAACTGGTDAADPDGGTPAVTKPAPDTGDGDAGDDPDTPDTPEHPENEDPIENLYTLKYTTLDAVLNRVLDDETYKSISEEVSKGITLTAQTIDAVIDISSDLKPATGAKDKEAEEAKMDEIKTIFDGKIAEWSKNSNVNIDEAKKAILAQAEGKITLTKENKKYLGASGVMTLSDFYEEIGGYGYKISANEKTKVSLDGEFGYFSNHIESLSDNIDISKVIISSQKDRIGFIPAEELTKEIYNKLNLEKRNDNNLPTLNFELNKNSKVYKENGNILEFGLKHFWDIYSKYYKAGELSKLMEEVPFTEIDGRALVDNVGESKYTLFEEDGDTVKKLNDSSIKYFDVNELAAFTNKYKITDIRNLIISGTPKSDTNVNWTLTNIIFENDMTNLTNKSASDLNGIVYFKNLPYTNIRESYPAAYGIVKLDKLGYNFHCEGSKYNVLDLRNVTSSTVPPQANLNITFLT